MRQKLSPTTMGRAGQWSTTIRAVSLARLPGLIGAAEAARCKRSCEPMATPPPESAAG